VESEKKKKKKKERMFCFFRCSFFFSVFVYRFFEFL